MKGKKAVTKACPSRPLRSEGQFWGQHINRKEQERNTRVLGQEKTLNNNHRKINKKARKGLPPMNKEGRECVLRRGGGGPLVSGGGARGRDGGNTTIHPNTNTYTS